MTWNKPDKKIPGLKESVSMKYHEKLLSYLKMSAGGWGRGSGTLFNGYRVSVLQDTHALEIGGVALWNPEHMPCMCEALNLLPSTAP